MNQALKFSLGVVAGLAIEGLLFGLFSTILTQSPASTPVLSATSLLGVALAGLGFWEHRKGEKTLWSNFGFGLGVGIALIGFLEAGNGSLTMVQ